MEKEGYDPNHPIRIYMNGVFDILHYGHMRSFEKLKKMFPYVCVFNNWSVFRL